MAARPRILTLSVLWLAGCLEVADRELTECHPNCHPDAGMDAPMDALPMDALPMDAAGDQHPDAAPMDAEPHDTGEPELLPLEAIEATPHQITWRWNADQIPADAVSYRLRYATGIDQVSAAPPWDEADDLNLGYRISPHGPETVERTRVLDLEPNRTYYARLYGVREGGAEFAIAAGMGETPPVAELVLSVFDEDLPMETTLEGFNDPATAPQAYQGTSALWFESPAVSNAAALNLQRAIPPMLQERWGDAYLELFVLVSPEQPIAYVQVMLGGFLGEADGLYSYFALPPHAWQRLEIPMASFAPAPMAAIIDRFGIRASSWGEVTAVYVDAVAVRY